MKREHVSVLGSTGSIGENTLDVIGRNPEHFRVVALTANRNIDKLAEQCARFDASNRKYAGASRSSTAHWPELARGKNHETQSDVP